MKIKILALALIALMLLPMLFACDEGTTTDTTTSAEELEEPLFEKVKISSGANADYKVIRSEYITLPFYNNFLEFMNDLKEKTGAGFKPYDDYAREGDDKSGELEIIFGTANRPECKELYDTINYDGYAIKKVGNKIIIAAYQPEKIADAMDIFLNECISVEEVDGVKTAYFVKEAGLKGEETLFFTSENPISDYKIIYSSEAEAVAKSLSKLIKKHSGVELEYLLDTKTAEGEKEILLGDTNRKESKEDRDITKIGFLIKTSGSKVVIRAGSSATLENMADLLEENYMLVSPGFNFISTISNEHTSYKGTDNVELTEGADIRVMSFNILSEEWAADAGMEPRIAGVVGCILYYSPDVIGIQEVSVKWYKVLKEYLGNTYEFVNTDAAGTTNGNYTGLAYKKSTVELVDKDLYYYSIGNSKRLRLVNMGYFKHIETGKNFIVTDTHFNADHQGAAIENKNRVTQATEFIARLEKYKNEYKCPIICTGDFNSQDGSDPYNKVVENGMLTEAKNTALKKGKICRTYHALGSAPDSNKASIDHIFNTNDVTALYYTTLVDNYLNISSDHNPIYADFKFN